MCLNMLVNVSKHVAKRTSNSIHKYGVTICFDGWDNVVKCPLLSMMFTCTSGDVFLCAINIVKEHKDAHYICNTLVGYIETIKVDNIVQIYTKVF